MSFWVGVKSYDNHVVFKHDGPTKKTHPQFEYVIGPFDTKDKAIAYAEIHKNVDGTFTDPFCNRGEGR